jgi:hypothetical protein
VLLSEKVFEVGKRQGRDKEETRKSGKRQGREWR